jgi:NAD+ diphosphatase
VRFEQLRIAVYRGLPKRLQVLAVRWSTPNVTVGTVAFVTRTGGELLLVRPAYRAGWVPPGGLARRGETPEACLARELVEELGIEVRLSAPHRVSFAVTEQVVTFVCAGVPVGDAEPRPCSPEILDARWFPVDALPPQPRDFHEGILPADLRAARRAAAPDPHKDS